VADDPASDDLPRGFLRAVLWGAVAIAGVAIAAAATIEEPLIRLVDVLFPYPLAALIGAALAAWIAARLRHAPAASPGGRLHPWWWVISRLAFIAAATCLLVAWIVAALIGASLASTLVEAFVLATMARVIFGIAEIGTINARRAIRGPAGAA
jgi:hypothetical protein